MPTVDDMAEEPFGLLQALPSAPQPIPLTGDGRGAPGLVPVQEQADLGEAHPDLLAGTQHAQTLQILLCVLAMARRGAPGRDGADLVPVAQHVLGYSDLPGGVGDPHGAILALTSGRPEGLASGA